MKTGFVVSYKNSDISECVFFEHLDVAKRFMIAAIKDEMSSNMRSCNDQTKKTMMNDIIDMDEEQIFEKYSVVFIIQEKLVAITVKTPFITYQLNRIPYGKDPLITGAQ